MSRTHMVSIFDQMFVASQNTVGSSSKKAARRELDVRWKGCVFSLPTRKQKISIKQLSKINSKVFCLIFFWFPVLRENYLLCVKYRDLGLAVRDSVLGKRAATLQQHVQATEPKIR